MIEINAKYEIQQKSITLRLKGINLNLRVYNISGKVFTTLLHTTFFKSSFTTFDLILQKCFNCPVGGGFVSFQAYNKHLWKSTVQKYSVTFYLYFQLSLNKKLQKTYTWTTAVVHDLYYLPLYDLWLMCFDFWIPYLPQNTYKSITQPLKETPRVWESSLRNGRVTKE